MNSIVIVIPTLSQGGAERVASILANKWSQIELSVHIVLLAKANRAYKLNNNINIYELEYEHPGNIFAKFLFELKVFLKLRIILNSIKPKAVLSFMTKYNSFTILASIGLNVNIFVTDRSNPFKKITVMNQILRKVTYPFAKGIIAQTHVAKDELFRITGHNNIAIIPNPLREVLKYQEITKEKIILNIGRLVPEKGHEYLLKSIAMIQDEDWKVVILGEGPLRNNLIELSKSLNISNRVLFPGNVNNVDEWLARSSIFVLTSISEGFPNALLEAMAAGLPCISFDCPAGPAEIISDGIDGHLVKVGDIYRLAELIKLLMNDRNHRDYLVSNINLEKYELTKIADEYLSFMLNDSIPNSNI